MQHYNPRTYKARTSLGYLVKTAHMLMVDQMEAALAERDMTFTQWVVLLYLRDGMAVNASTLCVRLRHDSGALTRVVDQLETRGWVQRHRSTADRRAVEIKLTDAGATLIVSLLPQVVGRLNWVLRDFSKAEVAELTRLMDKLIDGAQVAPAAAESA